MITDDWNISVEEIDILDLRVLRVTSAGMRKRLGFESAGMRCNSFESV